MSGWNWNGGLAVWRSPTSKQFAPGALLPIDTPAVLAAAPGSYALTGAAAQFPPPAVLQASPGGYTLTGAASQGLRERLLDATPGGVLLSGVGASLLRSRVADAGPGVYSLVGDDIDGTITLAGPGFDPQTMACCLLKRRGLYNRGP